MFFGFHVDVEPGAHVTGLNIDHTQLKMARELLLLQCGEEQYGTIADS